MSTTRRTAVTSLGGVLLGSAIPSASSGNTSLVSPHDPKIITVGETGDYPTPKDALDSITDSSFQRPYVILIAPGLYAEQRLEIDSPYVTLRGFGENCTILQTRDSFDIRPKAPAIALRDLRIVGTTSNVNQACVRRTGGLTDDLILDNVRIDHYGPGSAFDLQSQNWKVGTWLRNCRIITDGIGIKMSGGQVRLFDSHINLFGLTTGQPHIGIDTKGGRLHVHGGFIGSEYGNFHDGTNSVIPVVDDPGQDVIGIRLGGTNVVRAFLHGVESFCRQENNIGGEAINCVRVEGNAWLRVFGCFLQAEAGLTAGQQRTIWNQAGTGGKVEVYGSRVSNIAGPYFGHAMQGSETLTTEDDGIMLDKFEGGIHRMDASLGQFEVRLAQKGANFTDWERGMRHTFVKVDSSDNAAIVKPTSTTIEGSSSSVFLTAQWQKVTLVWTGFEWISETSGLM